jgi:LacI family transcriptional regulator
VSLEFVEALKAGAGYTAAIALNDLVAEQALRVFREHGIRVPEDVSLIGYDNNLDSQLLGITTMHLPIEEMGETAANLLLRPRPENPHAGNWLLALEPTLVVRGSTGPAPQ